MAPPPYALPPYGPYYIGKFDGRWEQPPMAPYAFHPGWVAPRKSVHERISYPIQDRLSYGANRSMQSHPKEASGKMWRAESSSAIIPESAKTKEDGIGVKTFMVGTEVLKLKEPIVIDDPAISSGGVVAVPQGPMTNDHEASTSEVEPRDPKYTQPKWCPPGISKSQKRRLQRMRSHEKVEQEAEKLRDEWFNEDRPMVPAAKVWRPKQIDNTVALPTPVVPREDDANAIVSSTPSITSPSLENTSESVDMHEEEELLDYEPTPIHESMDINMVFYLPAEFRAVDEEGEVAHLDYGPKNAIFEKPKEPVTHLRPLYLKGHIDGSPVSRMLVDCGAVVNLMPYSVFKNWV